MLFATTADQNAIKMAEKLGKTEGGPEGSPVWGSTYCTVPSQMADRGMNGFTGCEAIRLLN